MLGYPKRSNISKNVDNALKDLVNDLRLLLHKANNIQQKLMFLTQEFMNKIRKPKRGKLMSENNPICHIKLRK